MVNPGLGYIGEFQQNRLFCCNNSRHSILNVSEDPNVCNLITLELLC